MILPPTSLITCHIVWWVTSFGLVHSQGTLYWNNKTQCYNTSSSNYCYTAPFKDNGTGPPFLQMNYTDAREWCSEYVSGSSLLVITSVEIQRNIEKFLNIYLKQNDTVITDARKIKSRQWSWVNGQQFQSPASEQDNNKDEGGVKVAALDIKNSTSLTHQYSFHKASDTFHGFICEFPEGSSVLINTQSGYINFKSSLFTDQNLTWYDARERCLTQGGDLASIPGISKIDNWSWLQQGHKYWIGLHRNEWFWNSTENSTGRPRRKEVTYTKWESGYPKETDYLCICLLPFCKYNTSDHVDGGKWQNCKCNKDHTVVCQTEKKLEPSASFTVQALTPFRPRIPTTAKSEPIEISTSSLTPSLSSAETTTPASTTTTATTRYSPRLSSSATTTDTALSLETNLPMIAEILTKSGIHQKNFETGSSQNLLPILLVLIVVTLVVVVTVIVVLKFRKKNGNNQEPSIGRTDETQKGLSSPYGIVMNGNSRSTDGPGPEKVDYAELEMAPKPSAPNNGIYASVSPAADVVPLSTNTVYADLDVATAGGARGTSASRPQPAASGKVAPSVSPVYALPADATVPMNNAIYAEPYQPNRSTLTAAGSTVEQNKAATLSSSTGPKDKNPVYAEPIKTKKSP